MRDGTAAPDPNVRYDIGGWISGPCLDQPLNVPPGMTDQEAADLWAMRNVWERFYLISFASDVWRASRVGTSGQYTITADSAGELRGLVWADYVAWQREAQRRR